MVTIIGDAFIDIIVPVRGVKEGETHHRKLISLCGGTANVAVQISKLGIKSKFVGKVGDDLFGKYFKQNLSEKGIRDLTSVDYKNPTGLCISMVYESGERAMIVNRGANDYLKKKEIRNFIDEIANSKIVYFSGYSLLSRKNASGILYAIKEARKNDCKIYFNPGAPNIVKKDFKQIIADSVNVLILNAEEAKNMTKKNKIKEMLKSLNKMVDTAVITLDKGGCVISMGDRYLPVEAKKLNVSDTTGAGDAFSAGFIVGKLKNMKDAECAGLGNEVAANFLKKKMELIR